MLVDIEKMNHEVQKIKSRVSYMTDESIFERRLLHDSHNVV